MTKDTKDAVEIFLDELDGSCVKGSISHRLSRIIRVQHEALKFYAAHSNWDWQETPAGEDEYIPATHDCGERANTALTDVEAIIRGEK